MNLQTFERLCDEQIERCKELLIDKNKEYATETDVLHNFRVAAEMQGISVKQALAGMMAKHTVSIYDLCRNGGSIITWEEKLTDSINYLLLLNAMVREREDGKTDLYA